MLVDGKQIAKEIEAALREKVKLLPRAPKLVVVSTASDSLRYVSTKKRFAESIGVEFVHEYVENPTTTSLVERITAHNADISVTGIVVQLPLSKEIDTDKVLATIHPLKDPDSLSGGSEVLAPVAEAVAEILRRNSVDVRDKQVVVVGYGRLVGKPVAQWFLDHGAHIFVADISTSDLAERVRAADIVITGAGVPGLVTPDMVKDGAVVIDAGTSESNGKVVGDVDVRCAEKTSVMTPVPGGVGPIAVAKLFENLVELARRSAE